MTDIEHNTGAQEDWRDRYMRLIDALDRYAQHGYSLEVASLAQQPAAPDISSGHYGDSSGHMQPAAVDGIERLTEQQAVIVTGYTGVLIGEFDAFHADLERRAGRPVFMHEMADSGWIKPLYRDDFLALAAMTPAKRKRNDR